MTNKAKKNSSGSYSTILGIAIFAVLILWGLYHGIIGPSVIEPTTGTPEPVSAPASE